MKRNIYSIFFLCLLVQSFDFGASQQPTIPLGVNYGLLGNNLPPPLKTAEFLKKTPIKRIRLYGADESVIQAFGSTGIDIAISVINDEMVRLADMAVANEWVKNNVLRYLPTSKITTIIIGNEVLTAGTPDMIKALPVVMTNIYSALNAAKVSNVRVTTPHSMLVIEWSNLPAAAHWNHIMIDSLVQILDILWANGSPFMINLFPYFVYQANPVLDHLDYCLFNSTKKDPTTKLTYTSQLDEMVDTVRATIDATNGAKYAKVPIVISETGWPSRGEPKEQGPGVENAQKYISKLIEHVNSGEGTPLLPRAFPETYIFSLFDENMRAGNVSMQSFGVFNPDFTGPYNNGIIIGKRGLI